MGISPTALSSFVPGPLSVVRCKHAAVGCHCLACPAVDAVPLSSVTCPWSMVRRLSQMTTDNSLGNHTPGGAWLKCRSADLVKTSLSVRAHCPDFSRAASCRVRGVEDGWLVEQCSVRGTRFPLSRVAIWQIFQRPALGRAIDHPSLWRTLPTISPSLLGKPAVAPVIRRSRSRRDASSVLQMIELSNINVKTERGY